MKKGVIIAIIVILILLKVEEYKYFVSKAKDETKFGVINAKGELLVDEKYDSVEIPNPSKEIFLCTNNEKNVVLNSEGDQLYTEYDNIELLQLKNVASDLMYEKSVMKYEKDGKYGLINLEGEALTEPIYEEIDTLQYKEGELLVKKDGKYGVINQKGYVLVEPLYDKITADTFFDDEEKYYHDGYVVANKTDNGYRYGYVAYNGKEYLDTLYNDLQRVTEAGNKDEVYLIVAENGRYGIFKNDKQLIETDYQSISYDSNVSIFIVQQGKLYGAIDLEGKQILSCKFEELDVKGKYLYTISGENQEVYDVNGNLTNISPNTTIVAIPENDEYTIRVDTEENQTNYQICKQDTPINGESYKYIAYLKDNLCIASKTGEKLGIIDLQGNEKSEFSYTSIQVIPNTELVQMVKDESIAIADKSGNIITEMENGQLIQKDNYLRIYNETDQKYISLGGQIISNKEIFKDNKLFVTIKDGKWGFEDAEGNIIVEPIYDRATEFNKYGFATVLKDGKWGMIKQDGKVGIDPSESDVTLQAEPQFISEYHQIQLSSGKAYYTK